MTDKTPQEEFKDELLRAVYLIDANGGKHCSIPRNIVEFALQKYDNKQEYL